MLKKAKYNISGKNIKSIRLKKNISQEDLAIKLQLKGIKFTPSTISKIESEDRSVSDKELLAFSQVLNVSLEELILKKHL